jgi:OFA family oxalate/formate antiporter-like MFS transporter
MKEQNTSTARGWTVVFAALAINLVLGSLYAWTTMARALGQQWHWGRDQTAMPFAFATASFATTMIFAGRLQDKIGPRFVVIAGGIMLGLGLIASSFTTNPWMMALAFGVVGGIGIGLGYSATTPPSIKWFPPSRKGLITGLVVSGIGLSAVYISPLTKFLLQHTSIPETFRYLGFGTIVSVCLLAFLVANPPLGYTPAPASAIAVGPRRAAPAAGRDVDWPDMLRTPQFYQLWLMLALAAFAGLMIISQVAFIAKEQAGVEKLEALPVAILAIFNTVGRIAGGFLSDRIGRTRTMFLAFVLQAVNMFVFVHYNTLGWVIFGAAFTGICYGTLFPLMPSAIADFFGVRNLGVNYGLLFTAFGVAGVCGPVIGARIHVLFGSYKYSYIVSAVMLLVGAAIALTVRPPKAVSPPTPAPQPEEPSHLPA